MEWIIAGIFSLIIGVVGLWTALKQLKNRAELSKWKTTEGRVIERGTFKPNAPSLSPPAFHHAPLVKYTYAVDGKEFVSNWIHPARIQVPPRNTQKWAQKRAESFPDAVMVHYNSADPGEAYLIQTSGAVLLTVGLVSAFMILLGLLILLARALS